MFSGAKVRRRGASGYKGITGATQEDGSIDAALARLSASMTAPQKGDREKEGSKCEEKKQKKKIHRSFLNPVSLTDPKSESVQACREAAGCDELFSTSSPCIYRPLSPSLALSRGRKGV